jgi:acyl-CoA thioesterase FadM
MASEQLILERTSPLEIGKEFIDLYDHINHLAYAILFERQRAGILNARNSSLEDIRREYGLFCVVTDLSLAYPGFAVEGDTVYIETQIKTQGRIRLRFDQRMLKGDRTIVTSSVGAVFINEGSLRPVEPPSTLKDRLSTSQADLPAELQHLLGREYFPYPRAAFNAILQDSANYSWGRRKILSLLLNLLEKIVA